jgi:MoaA/NifB/PqqE/SkfB family radical SAM enzyme
MFTLINMPPGNRYITFIMIATKPSDYFYSAPKYIPSEVINTAFHNEMLEIAFPNRKTAETRRWRPRKLNRFRLLKLMFFIRQKYFYPRLLNYIRYRREAHKKANVQYIPPSVQMESSTGCALQCPGCLVGTKNATGHPDKVHFTTPEMYKREIDLVAKKSVQLYLHMHAEPLLNEHVFDACRYAASKGVWTGLHTNFYPNVPDLAEKILDSKLCNLVVSVDGATQEIYEMYRVGGNLETVFNKIRGVAEMKKKRKSKYPWITAKFLVFEHNWHEIKLFREKALQNGANEVIYITGYANGVYKTGNPCTEYEFNLNTLAWQPLKLPERCPYLWEDLRIDTDGGVFPCGNGFNDAHKFFNHQNGNGVASITEQFNTANHIKMRSYFLGKESLQQFPAPCNRCEIVKASQGKRTA